MIEEIISLFPDIEFKTHDLLAYESDASEDLQFLPSLVALPNSTQQVSQLVKYCNEHTISIFPRGAGTGLVGGSLANSPGVMISLEKMNRIVDIDKENFMATVEAGVINHDLQQALAPLHLFYPPDPSSWQSCFIGGNVATNAGGPRAVKYGVTSHWILNLEVVLPNGEIIWTGKNTLKNSTGYNLTQLYIGSEGTLGIVTQIVVKLAPKPLYESTMLVEFLQLEESAGAVSLLFSKGLQPSTLELVERKALEKLKEFSAETYITLSENTQAILLISFDGNKQEDIMSNLEKTYELLTEFSIEEPIIAENQTDLERIWQARRKLAEVVKANGFTIEEDTVVPRNQLPNLIKFAHGLEEKYPIELVCYGHAGDGNLHIRINHPEYKYSYQNPKIEVILEELFTYINSIGGTISGEHGIGIVQEKYLPIVFNSEEISIQKSIKKAIDPKNIMNPGKIFKEI